MEYKASIIHPATYANPHLDFAGYDAVGKEFATFLHQRLQTVCNMRVFFSSKVGSAYFVDFSELEEGFLKNSEYVIIIATQSSMLVLRQFFARLIVFITLRPQWNNRFIVVFVGDVVLDKKIDLSLLYNKAIYFPAHSWEKRNNIWMELYSILKVEWKELKDAELYFNNARNTKLSTGKLLNEKAELKLQPKKLKSFSVSVNRGSLLHEEKISQTPVISNGNYTESKISLIMSSEILTVESNANHLSKIESNTDDKNTQVNSEPCAINKQINTHNNNCKEACNFESTNIEFIEQLEDEGHDKQNSYASDVHKSVGSHVLSESSGKYSVTTDSGFEDKCSFSDFHQLGDDSSFQSTPRLGNNIKAVETTRLGSYRSLQSLNLIQPKNNDNSIFTEVHKSTLAISSMGTKNLYSIEPERQIINVTNQPMAEHYTETLSINNMYSPKVTAITPKPINDVMHFGISVEDVFASPKIGKSDTILSEVQQLRETSLSYDSLEINTVYLKPPRHSSFRKNQHISKKSNSLDIRSREFSSTSSLVIDHKNSADNNYVTTITHMCSNIDNSGKQSSQININNKRYSSEDVLSIKSYNSEDVHRSRMSSWSSKHPTSNKINPDIIRRRVHRHNSNAASRYRTWTPDSARIKSMNEDTVFDNIEDGDPTFISKITRNITSDAKSHSQTTLNIEHTQRISTSMSSLHVKEWSHSLGKSMSRSQRSDSGSSTSYMLLPKRLSNASISMPQDDEETPSIVFISSGETDTHRYIEKLPTELMTVYSTCETPILESAEIVVNEDIELYRKNNTVPNTFSDVIKNSLNHRHESFYNNKSHVNNTIDMLDNQEWKTTRNYHNELLQDKVLIEPAAKKYSSIRESFTLTDNHMTKNIGCWLDHDSAIKNNNGSMPYFNIYKNAPNYNHVVKSSDVVLSENNLDKEFNKSTFNKLLDAPKYCSIQSSLTLIDKSTISNIGCWLNNDFKQSNIRNMINIDIEQNKYNYNHVLKSDDLELTENKSKKNYNESTINKRFDVQKYYSIDESFTLIDKSTINSIDCWLNSSWDVNKTDSIYESDQVILSENQVILTALGDASNVLNSDKSNLKSKKNNYKTIDTSFTLTSNLNKQKISALVYFASTSQTTKMETSKNINEKYIFLDNSIQFNTPMPNTYTPVANAFTLTNTLIKNDISAAIFNSASTKQELTDYSTTKFYQNEDNIKTNESVMKPDYTTVINVSKIDFDEANKENVEIEDIIIPTQKQLCMAVQNNLASNKNDYTPINMSFSLVNKADKQDVYAALYSLQESENRQGLKNKPINDISLSVKSGNNVQVEMSFTLTNAKTKTGISAAIFNSTMWPDSSETTTECNLTDDSITCKNKYITKEKNIPVSNSFDYDDEKNMSIKDILSAARQKSLERQSSFQNSENEIELRASTRGVNNKKSNYAKSFETSFSRSSEGKVLMKLPQEIIQKYIKREKALRSEKSIEHDLENKETCEQNFIDQRNGNQDVLCKIFLKSNTIDKFDNNNTMEYSNFVAQSSHCFELTQLPINDQSNSQQHVLIENVYEETDVFLPALHLTDTNIRKSLRQTEACNDIIDARYGNQEILFKLFDTGNSEEKLEEFLHKEISMIDPSTFMSNLTSKAENAFSWNTTEENDNLQENIWNFKDNSITSNIDENTNNVKLEALALKEHSLSKPIHLSYEMQLNKNNFNKQTNVDNAKNTGDLETYDIRQKLDNNLMPWELQFQEDGMLDAYIKKDIKINDYKSDANDLNLTSNNSLTNTANKQNLKSLLTENTKAECLHLKEFSLLSDSHEHRQSYCIEKPVNIKHFTTQKPDSQNNVNFGKQNADILLSEDNQKTQQSNNNVHIIPDDKMNVKLDDKSAKSMISKECCDHNNNISLKENDDYLKQIGNKSNNWHKISYGWNNSAADETFINQECLDIMDIKSDKNYLTGSNTNNEIADLNLSSKEKLTEKPNKKNTAIKTKKNQYKVTDMTSLIEKDIIANQNKNSFEALKSVDNSFKQLLDYSNNKQNDNSSLSTNNIISNALNNNSNLSVLTELAKPINIAAKLHVKANEEIKFDKINFKYKAADLTIPNDANVYTMQKITKQPEYEDRFQEDLINKLIPSSLDKKSEINITNQNAEQLLLSEDNANNFFTKFASNKPSGIVHTQNQIANEQEIKTNKIVPCYNMKTSSRKTSNQYKIVDLSNLIENNILEQVNKQNADSPTNFDVFSLDTFKWNLEEHSTSEVDNIIDSFVLSLSTEDIDQNKASFDKRSVSSDSSETQCNDDIDDIQEISEIVNDTSNKHASCQHNDEEQITEVFLKPMEHEAHSTDVKPPNVSDLLKNTVEDNVLDVLKSKENDVTISNLSSATGFSFPSYFAQNNSPLIHSTDSSFYTPSQYLPNVKASKDTVVTKRGSYLEKCDMLLSEQTLQNDTSTNICSINLGDDSNQQKTDSISVLPFYYENFAHADQNENCDKNAKRSTHKSSWIWDFTFFHFIQNRFNIFYTYRKPNQLKSASHEKQQPTQHTVDFLDRGEEEQQQLSCTRQNETLLRKSFRQMSIILQRIYLPVSFLIVLTYVSPYVRKTNVWIFGGIYQVVTFVYQGFRRHIVRLLNFHPRLQLLNR